MLPPNGMLDLLGGRYTSSLSLLGVATGGTAAASWFDSFDVGQGVFIRVLLQ